MQRGQNLLRKMRLLCQSLKQFWNLRYKSCHDLAYLRNERTERVLGVGSVLLQLLDAQQQLNELPNLNGDLLGDLLDGRVVYCFNDGDAEISAMFAFVSGAGSEVADRLLKFKSEHLCSGPLLRMAIRNGSLGPQALNFRRSGLFNNIVSLWMISTTVELISVEKLQYG
ncbi:hypothetical protein C8J57DRAFT_1249206 [Mycena rebaudengoi]|nr:hypothetical protein C8J57DRAFT_1249206 [Mycena rebaudengoi]